MVALKYIIKTFIYNDYVSLIKFFFKSYKYRISISLNQIEKLDRN